MRILPCVLVFGLMACSAAHQRPVTQTTQPAATAAKPSASPPPPGQVNPNQATNDRLAQQQLEKIAGHENEPAEQVFKNVQWFKGVPAKRLLLIMNMGYSRALGVACTHCHVEEDFASDDKHAKKAAREMAAMHKLINEQLKAMQHLEKKAKDPVINCSTCHRGAVDPMAGER